MSQSTEINAKGRAPPFCQGTVLEDHSRAIITAKSGVVERHPGELYARVGFDPLLGSSVGNPRRIHRNELHVERFRVTLEIPVHKDLELGKWRLI